MGQARKPEVKPSDRPEESRTKSPKRLLFGLVCLCVLAGCSVGIYAAWKDDPTLHMWALRFAATMGVSILGLLFVAGLYIALFTPAPFEPRTERTETPPPDADGKQDTSAAERIKRLDEHIKFEFDLTAARVSYMASAEAFLFAAYGAALAAVNDVQTSEYDRTLNNLVNAVPWIGVILAVAVLAAVIGATSMIFKLKALREREEAGRGSLHPDIGWRSLEHFLGLMPPIVLSICFLVAWLCVWPDRDKPAAQAQAAGVAAKDRGQP